MSFNQTIHVTFSIIIQRKEYLKSSGVDIESATLAPYFDMIDEFLGTRDVISPRMLLQRNQSIGCLLYSAVYNNLI